MGQRLGGPGQSHRGLSPLLAFLPLPSSRTAPTAVLAPPRLRAADAPATARAVVDSSPSSRCPGHATAAACHLIPVHTLHLEIYSGKVVITHQSDLTSAFLPVYLLLAVTRFLSTGRDLSPSSLNFHLPPLPIFRATRDVERKQDAPSANFANSMHAPCAGRMHGQPAACHLFPASAGREPAHTHAITRSFHGLSHPRAVGAGCPRFYPPATMTRRLATLADCERLTPGWRGEYNG